MGGWGELYSIFLDFWNIFNFAKPLIKCRYPARIIAGGLPKRGVATKQGGYRKTENPGRGFHKAELGKVSGDANWRESISHREGMKNVIAESESDVTSDQAQHCILGKTRKRFNPVHVCRLTYRFSLFTERINTI